MFLENEDVLIYDEQSGWLKGKFIRYYNAKFAYVKYLELPKFDEWVKRNNGISTVLVTDIKKVEVK